MKKLFRTVMVLSMASLTVLTSCKKDDKSDVADATIDINAKVDGIAINDGANVFTGKTIKFTIVSTGNSDNKLKSVTMTTDASSTPVLAKKTLSGTSSTDTPSYTIATTGSISFTVTLESEKGSVTKSFKVTGVTPGGGILTSNTAIPLFGSDNGAGQNDNFMGLGNPLSTYSTSNFDITKVDLGFFVGDTKKFSLTGPQDADLHSQFSGLTWTGAKTTMLFKTTLTKAQFDAIVASGTDNGIVDAANGATYVSAVNNLSMGNVLLFKTQEQKLGLIYVNNITGTTRTDGIIYLDFVYQE